MIYICNHCKEIWDEFDVPKDIDHSYGADIDGNRGVSMATIKDSCPLCIFGEIVEGLYCSVCDNYYPETDEYCKICNEDILSNTDIKQDFDGLLNYNNVLHYTGETEAINKVLKSNSSNSNNMKL